MAKIFQSIFLSIMALVSTSCSSNEKPPKGMTPQTIHTFKVPGLMGDTIDFSTFKGKKILVVNTASKCGLTPQYEQLEQLYKKYSDRLVIVGFPANNFMSQEPGSNDEIAAFCQKNYGVSFPMAEKISVKGDDIAPIYQFLTDATKNGVEGSSVSWNFEKYLLDENGILIQSFSPKVEPLDADIIKAIEK